jgi:hypothetical protein
MTRDDPLPLVKVLMPGRFTQREMARIADTVMSDAG